MLELIADIAVTIVAFIVFAQFTWSLRAHFNSKDIPAGTRLISIMVVVTMAAFYWYLWTGVQPLLAQLAGLVIMAAGWRLFWMAIHASRAAKLRLAFDEEGPDSLVTEGPYKYVRHPFYTSYLIFWAGFAVAVWTPWTIAYLLVILAVYTLAALVEQGKFAHGPLAGQYAEYARRTGMFWPKWPPARD